MVSRVLSAPLFPDANLYSTDKSRGRQAFTVRETLLNQAYPRCVSAPV